MANLIPASIGPRSLAGERGPTKSTLEVQMARKPIRDERLARESSSSRAIRRRGDDAIRSVLAESIARQAQAYHAGDLADTLSRLTHALADTAHKIDGAPRTAIDVVHAAIDLIRASLPTSDAGNTAWGNRLDTFADSLAALARQSYGAPFWSDSDLREIGRKVAVAHLGYDNLALTDDDAMMVDIQAMAERLPQVVYFIGAGTSGPIKIGIAADPQVRISVMQTGHFEQLSILAVTNGGRDREQAYHRQFAARRMRGEWFQRCPEIEAEIVRLNKAAAEYERES